MQQGLQILLQVTRRLPSRSILHHHIAVIIHPVLSGIRFPIALPLRNIGLVDRHPLQVCPPRQPQLVHDFATEDTLPDLGLQIPHDVPHLRLLPKANSGLLARPGPFHAGALQDTAARLLARPDTFRAGALRDIKARLLLLRLADLPLQGLAEPTSQSAGARACSSCYTSNCGKRS